jgi:hypothetical protein
MARGDPASAPSRFNAFNDARDRLVVELPCAGAPSARARSRDAHQAYRELGQQPAAKRAAKGRRLLTPVVSGREAAGSRAIAHNKRVSALTAQSAAVKSHIAMPERDLHLLPRYEVRIHCESGEKRFAVHDLQQHDSVIGMFGSAKEACIQCALLWLEHVRAVRYGRPDPSDCTPSGRY